MNDTITRVPYLHRPLGLDSVRTWLLAIAVVLLLGTVYVGQSSQAVMTGQRVNDKQEKLDRILRENAQLEADIATLLAPNRVEARARTMGLHLPNPEQIRYLPLKDYPDESAQATKSGQGRTIASPASNMFDLAAWWTKFMANLGLAPGSHSAEATTTP